MIKKIFLGSLILSNFVFADNNFQDLNYLSDKTIIRETVQQLEVLKNYYTPNSKEYNTLNESQQIILNRLPVDAFGTYSRIKLNNIVDKHLVEDTYKQNANNILSPDTDLNFMYSQQKLEEDNAKKKRVTKPSNNNADQDLQKNAKEILKNSKYNRLYNNNKN